MGKSSPPPAPDYAAAAKQQGIEDRQTAVFNAAVNRPNETNVQGNRTWTLRPGADPNNLQAGDYQLTTTLSPTEQKLYDMDSQNRLGMGQLSNQMLSTVSKGLGTEFDMSKIPETSKIPGATVTQAGPELQAGYLNSGPKMEGLMISGGPTLNGTNVQAGPTLRQNQSLEGAARQFNPASYSADRELIAKAVYDSMTRRNEAQFARQEAQLRDRLVNQGLDENSKAFKDQMADFMNAKNDAYQEAARQAEIAGSQEQTRQDTSQGQAFQQQLGANESNFGQKATALSSNFGREQGAATTNFGTSKEAADSNFQRTAGAAAQNFGQQLASTESNFNRQQVANSQNFGQQAAAIDSNFSRGLASNQQNFQQGLQQYQASLAGRQNSVQEQAYLRSLPLNEINAVRSGSQVNMPQFQQYATGFAANSAPIYKATQDTYQAGVDQANASNAWVNGLMGLGGKIAGAAIGKWG